MLDNLANTIQEKYEDLKGAIFSSNERKEKKGIEVFNTRTCSSFGLSIGTGLALESIFQPTHERYDKERKIPNKIDIKNYNILAINVMTLARNIIESVNSKEIEFEELAKLKCLEGVLIAELNILEGLIFGEDIKIYAYLPDHEFISSKLNKGKKDTFTKVASRGLLLYKSLSKMKFDNCSVKVHSGSKFFKLNFKNSDRILLFSSYSYDFLNNFNISMLESHTGLLLTKERFNKRYKKLGDKSYDMLPYDELLLYLLGDNLTSMLCTKGESIRKAIYNLAIDKKWNPRTSIITIRSEISRNPVINEAMKNFTRIY